MKVLSGLLILAALGTGHAYAACSYPKAPDKLPDGSTATLQEMVAAQKLVKQYNDDIKAYTDCLKLEHDQEMQKADADKLTKEQKDEMDKVQVQKNNAAVDEAETVTNRFNEQVKIFKAKAADAKGKS
jgi:hypothetical protein